MDRRSGRTTLALQSTEQGAATSIWAAVAPELEGIGGLYLEDCTIAKPWSDDAPMSGVKPYAFVDPLTVQNAYGRFPRDWLRVRDEIYRKIAMRKSRVCIQ